MKGRPGEILFHLGVLALSLLLALLSLRYALSWDWTRDARNRLDAQSAALLAGLDAPLDLEVYSARNGPLGRRIDALLAPYQRTAPGHVRLRFIDPERHPEMARKAGIRLWGELVIRYRNRTEHLDTLDAAHIRNAVLRLLSRGQRWIVWLRGRGARRLDGPGPTDLGRFAAALRARGYRVQGLGLARHPRIPDNTALFVLAGPTRPLDEAAERALRAYLDRGGALWWLLDPAHTDPLPRLSAQIGLIPLPGTVIDPAAAERGDHNPLMALADYPAHPLTRGLEDPAVFPKAAALSADPPPPWRAVPVVTTGDRAWNETGPLEGRVRPDAPGRGERRGPLSLALAFERPLGEGRQRLLVTGDGDFLANAYLDRGGNRALGLRMTAWLLGEDRLLALPPAPPRQRLKPSPAMALVLGVGGLGVLPLGLALTGLFLRWRRGRE